MSDGNARTAAGGCPGEPLVFVARNVIEHAFEQWTRTLGLEAWDITCLFDEHQHIATTSADPRYLTAHIHFNLPRIEAELHSVGDVRRLVLHELCHCLTWPLAELAQNGQKTAAHDFLEEYVTTMVENAVWRAGMYQYA